jgi:23S rRNA (uracil1939-C5)-methyltransferase
MPSTALGGKSEMKKPRQGRSKRNRASNSNQMAGRLPRNAAPIEITITHIGGRGDGVGRAIYRHNYKEEEHDVFVPASLPGETLIVQPLSLTNQGIKGRIIELKKTSPERHIPRCGAFPACGGCSFQHWDENKITHWKADLCINFLASVGVNPATVRTPHISPPRSRRRASFRLKCLSSGAIVGFNEHMSQHIVRPEECSILHPQLSAVRQQIEDLAGAHFPLGFEANIQINILFNDDADKGYLCIYIKSANKSVPLPANCILPLVNWAKINGLARLTIDDAGGPVTIYAPDKPITRFGKIAMTPPAGAFLQATADGEKALQQAVAEIIGDSRRVIDLFAGCGTLSLGMIDQLAVLCAAEADEAALTALRNGSKAAGFGGRTRTIKRNLLEAPMLPDELANYDSAILDPPRSGAAAQCHFLAKSDIATIAMVSCNPASFARDAAILTSGGYRLDWIKIVDQFLFSNHVELVGAFIRPT